MEAGRKRVAIIFHRLGPYHRARLSAAASVFNVLAVEQSAETAEYLWDKVEDSGVFSRETLFLSGETRQSPREIRRRLSAVLERFGPDVVAVPGWSSRAALSALLWCRRAKVPAIIFSESTALDSARTVWKESLKKRVLSLCAASLVGGARHQEYIEQLGLTRDKVFLGYDAVDNGYFATGANNARQNAHELRNKLKLPECYFLASSRFLPQKNLFHLLESYADYRVAIAPLKAWDLVLLGDGPLRGELLSYVDSLGLREKVTFAGFVQYDGLPVYYGLAGAFVHASTREPWGLVVNEAMAAGLPVIVSERCGCAADLVTSGRNGYVFDPSDRRALTTLYERVASAPVQEREAMGNASRAIIGDWGLERFANGLQGAVEKAFNDRAATFGSWLDRLVVQFLAGR